MLSTPSSCTNEASYIGSSVLYLVRTPAAAFALCCHSNALMIISRLEIFITRTAGKAANLEIRV